MSDHAFMGSGYGFLPLSMIFILDSGTVPTVWNFLNSFLFFFKCPLFGYYVVCASSTYDV